MSTFITGEKLITKKCKETYSCKIQEKQNDKAAWFGKQCMPDFWINSHCRCCCDGDLCNDAELPCITNSTKTDCSMAGTIAPNNGTVSCSDKNRANSQCQHSCNSGFSITGNSQVTCHASGEWSTSIFPRCEISQCKLDLPDPVNGIVTCSQAKEYESVCKFYCDQGYTLTKEGTDQNVEIYEQVQCQINGPNLYWEFSHPDVPSDYKIVSSAAHLPKCVRSKCPAIVLNKGHIDCDDGFMYKSECRFRCDEGYVLDGSKSVTCRGVEKPNWDAKLPNCRPTIVKQKRSVK